MTIENLIDNVKFDFNNKSTDNIQKNCLKDKGSGFLNIFESANKSYNFSFKETEKFSYKNSEQFNKNKDFKSKEFKSDYENFYNKINTNKNIDTPIKKRTLSETKEAISAVKEERKKVLSESKEKVSEAKEERKEEVSEAKSDAKAETKEAVSEMKEERKEVLSETKENVSEAKEERKEAVSEVNNPTKAETVENINLNNPQNIDASLTQQPQAILQNAQEVNVPLQKNNNGVELTANSLEKNLPEELTTIQKQIANEKITNKQAETLLQQQSAEVEEETSDIQTQLTKINPEELKKTDTKIADQAANQAQLKKPEILASEDLINKLNNADKNQVKLPQGETLKPVSDKLSETINNQDSKPVITNIEVNNDSSKTNSDDKSQNQNQKQAQQELKPNINQTQTISADENNLQKIDIQKTSQFDKILNTKQTQTLENSVLNQLKDKISTDAAGKSQVNIILKPENLGKVNINLVTQNGVLTAQITAENSQVKDILNKGLETLRQNMAEQGINVGKMVVNVQEPQSSNQNTHSDNNSKNFEQANSNTSNMNHQSDKQNNSEYSSSASLDNELYEFDEEIENENEKETGESKILAGQSSVNTTGRVDYKV